MNITSNLYEQDYYQWTQRTAQLIQQGQFSELDIEHLIEEIESMGASERREMESRLIVLISHLLKYHYLTQWREENGRGWQATIKEQRHALKRLFKRNPSLKAQLSVLFNEGDLYQDGYLKAIAQTNNDSFPAHCPYSLEQILTDDFFPV